MFEGKKPRSLTLPEWREARAADENDADVIALAYGYDVDRDAVAAWFNGAPMKEAMAAVAAVLEASGLTEAASFPDAPGDGPVDGGAV